MNIEDKIHLEFIHNRLIDVYGESRNTDFVKKLRDIINDEPKGQELPIHIVSNAKRTFCNNCKSGLIDYPEINRRTCRCGALGHNVTE